MAETPMCPACGMPKSAWQANQRPGIHQRGASLLLSRVCRGHRMSLSLRG